ncbi:Ribosomal protein S18 acetylase RimI [Paenibacillus algorifonticola]|uniref:Ribosomal protein S18 acetylase RimI n=1 Tax=Paenibacillus algorifonticola TaxID=684063 RepID=A0A1I1YYR2_9BACL|nr:GNAT family N-acetyltransferase [Paenibacillus algorifonticola]SFE23303.1 Ribosomal protein S18 acetylase RimI [Paenibacillus algorifonticola]
MNRTQEITIVEYEPRYAGSIAAMWNTSHESWGGDDSLQTEQSILKEHHNSTFLHVYLAIAGGEVVGYCSFSHYKEDAGALYIPLLNVRPDYHGHKIGKRLILRAIEETLKLGWPRLDLYTWPGNTKAVPAYKKSGFFWEKRDDTTHLMNLIPSVLQTGAVKHYFEEINWYSDSVREIAVSPDGRQERGFDYFTYEWKKGSSHLRMEYERTGRGLRLIETDDYLIKATIPDYHQLPFGVSYPIIYEAVNKSGKTLALEIKSVGSAAISFELHETRIVESQERIEGSFLVHAIEEDQSPFQTHPVVEAELLINGLPATFKTGIEPKFPAKLKLQAPAQSVYAGEHVALDLTIENEYETEAVFAFELPDDEVLSFSHPSVRIKVPAKGRRTVTIEALLLTYGIWHHRLAIHNVAGSDDSLVLQQGVSLVFPGIHAAFGGETDQDWVISNGQYSARLNKSSNILSIYEGAHSTISLHYPKFGLPYSSAFEKNRVSRVTCRQDEAMVLEAQYDLTSADLLLTLVVKLYSNGIITRHHVVQNKAAAVRDEPLFLKESFNFDLEDSVIPYEGQYVDLSKGPDASNSDYWEKNRFTENWIFANNGESSRGITWPEQAEIISEGWYYGLEHPLGVIPAGGITQTEPIRIALGTWRNWRDFRSFALNRGYSQELETTEQLETIVNQGNPFLQGALEVRIVERKNTFLEGEIEISSALDSIDTAKHLVSGEQQLTEIVTPVTWKSSLEADILTLRLDMESYGARRSRLVFPVSDHTITQQTEHTEYGEVLMADNGVMQIQASSGFAPALFSLKHRGVEWLDSSFPHPGPKSWWNPWIGGIAAEVSGMSGTSFMEEPREAAFAAITDNLGNDWSGIRMSVTISNHAKFRGLVLHQYFLMLPGVPVLATVIRVEQNTGAPLHPLTLANSTFYRASSDMKESRGYVKNNNGENIIYKAGRVQYSVSSTNGIIQYGSRERKQRLTFIAHPEIDSSELHVNTDVAASVATEKLFLQDGKQQFSKPQFYIISDLFAPEEAYQDLLNIRFDQLT